MRIFQSYACLIITLWRFVYRNNCYNLIGTLLKDCWPFLLIIVHQKVCTCNACYVLNAISSKLCMLAYFHMHFFPAFICMMLCSVSISIQVEFSLCWQERFEDTKGVIRRYQRGNQKITKGVIRRYQRGNQKIPKG
jgi:hypothetical protein